MHEAGTSKVIVEDAVPQEWKQSRLTPLYKGMEDRRDLCNHCPISVSPVLHQMGAQVIRDQLQRWAEKGILREQQTAFHAGRRIDDSLFVLTQYIEIAKQTWRQHYAAFLDISQA